MHLLRCYLYFDTCSLLLYILTSAFYSPSHSNSNTRAGTIFLSYSSRQSLHWAFIYLFPLQSFPTRSQAFTGHSEVMPPSQATGCAPIIWRTTSLDAHHDHSHVSTALLGLQPHMKVCCATPKTGFTTYMGIQAHFVIFGKQRRFSSDSF